MIGSPLREFAQRIIRNGEYQQLVEAIIEQGGNLEALKSAMSKHRYVEPEQPGVNRKSERSFQGFW
jgi:hypothetical protein